MKIRYVYFLIVTDHVILINLITQSSSWTISLWRPVPDFSNHFVHLNPPLSYDHLQASNQQPVDRIKSHPTEISYYFFIVTLPIFILFLCVILTSLFSIS